MKILTHPAMLALGAAMLYLLTFIAPLVTPTHLPIFHMWGSVSSIILSVLLNLFVVWLLLTPLFMVASKPGRLRIAFWSIFVLSLPWVLLKTFAVLSSWDMPHLLSLSVLGASLILLLLMFILWKPSFVPYFEHVQDFVSTVMMFLSLGSLILLAQLGWLLWQTRTLNNPRPLHQRKIATSDDSSRTRVIWLVLDELAYQQVYEQRFKGLELPAFDRLAAESTVFTHTVSIANATEIVIPSLMTGIPGDQVRASPRGDLSLHDASKNAWRVFDPHQTIFQDALDSGYGTAIAGWFNPYCRMLSPVLDRCYWSEDRILQLEGFDTDRSIGSNALVPFLHSFYEARSIVHGKGLKKAEQIADARAHIADYQKILSFGDQLLDDPSIDFLFLHMPVPHPEGIYNRTTANFTVGPSSYIDNLALADQYLAHVRSLLEQHGQWKSAAIIVMGDHSWRTKTIWKPNLIWTAEDEAASHGGQFDDRPGYIVKLPNQQQPAHIDDRFEAVRTRALLDGIITNRIKTPEDLAAWVRQPN